MTDLLTLTGSEKQVKWAEEVRNTVIEKLILRFERAYHLPHSLAERLWEPAYETVNDYPVEARLWINPIVGERLEDHFWTFFELNAHRFIQEEMKREQAEKDAAALPDHVPSKQEAADPYSFYNQFTKPAEEYLKGKHGGARPGAGRKRERSQEYDEGYNAGYVAGLRKEPVQFDCREETFHDDEGQCQVTRFYHKETGTLCAEYIQHDDENFIRWTNVDLFAAHGGKR
jgi:hypothetical protein